MDQAMHGESAVLSPELQDRLLYYASRAPSPHNAVTAASGGQALVLRRRFVDELRKTDPACAADVPFGLARVLADRQYVPAS